MRNLFKIFVLLTIFTFIFFVPYAKASSVNMDLNVNSTDDGNSYYEDNNDANYDNDDDSYNYNDDLDEDTTNSQAESNTPSISINKTTSDDDGTLTLGDILSIVIIVIGIILIALGVAILIRCK